MSNSGILFEKRIRGFEREWIAGVAGLLFSLYLVIYIQESLAFSLDSRQLEEKLGSRNSHFRLG
ncbi:hypothetical protein V6Z11_A09G276700 [Gossypium hirsutum]